MCKHKCTWNSIVGGLKCSIGVCVDREFHVSNIFEFTFFFFFQIDRFSQIVKNLDKVLLSKEL